MPQHSRTIAVVCLIVLAITATALALMVGADAWAAWFSHPAQQRPELTLQGAKLWRLMLSITAVLSAALAVVCLMAGPPAPMAEHRANANQPANSRQTLAIIAGCVTLAFFVRSFRIGESLWYDEIASWMTYSAGVQTLGAVFGNFFDPINHPFHTLLNHLAVKWLAESMNVELAFRLPALVFSLLSIYPMFAFVKAAAGVRAGAIAAFLAAVFPICVLEGAEARGYSMVIFFAAMANWLLLEARRTRQPSTWLWYSICCALGVWSHFVFAFVPIGHGVWLAWRGMRHGDWRTAISGGLALVFAGNIALTLYSPMIPAMLASRGMFAAQNADQPTILGPEGLHALYQLGGSWYWWAAVPGLVAFAIGLVAIARDSFIASADAPQQACACAAGASLIGFPLMLIVVGLTGTWVYARFMLFAMPGAILLIAIGIDRLWNWRRAGGFAALTVIACAAAADNWLRPPKQPLRDAAEFVRDHRSSQDRLLVVGLAHEVERIYADDLNLTYSFRHGRDLPQKLATTSPEWIIVEYPNSVSPETYALIRSEGFAEAAHFRGWVDWTNGDVVVYRRN